MKRKTVYTKKEFLKLDPTFKIETVISDGMWYTTTKWRKLAGVSEDELQAWIDEKLEDGTLIQSSTGAKSFRIPLAEVEKWYKKHKLDINIPVVDFLFQPRIWDGMTEVEGLINSPRREVGVVTFRCTERMKERIVDELQGIAVVREENIRESKYKAYGLSANYIKEIILDLQNEYPDDFYKKVYPRNEVKRREIIDFSPEFSRCMIDFYTSFAKTLLKDKRESMSVFLPTVEEQDSQILIWTIQAMEKYDETSSVPFSGYFNNVLSHWPYDLPEQFLGKELSEFQQNKAKALKSLKVDMEDEEKVFSASEIAKEMGISEEEFTDLEESHQNWIRTKTTTSLIWDDNGEEKESNSLGVSPHTPERTTQDQELAFRLSHSVISAALETAAYEDAYVIIRQIDSPTLNFSQIENLSEDFVQSLARNMSERGA